MRILEAVAERVNKLSSRILDPKEGLQGTRALMVLSSLSPLFILWTIRGSCLIPNPVLFIACGLLVVPPTAFLLLWIRRAKNKRLKETLFVGKTEDHTNHVLVYLFANLFPFFQEDPKSYRELLAIVLALAFIAYIFYRLNLHYINIFYAFRGYRLFTVSVPKNDSDGIENESFIVISKRRFLSSGESFPSYRLTDTVYLEISE